MLVGVSTGLPGLGASVGAVVGQVLVGLQREGPGGVGPARVLVLGLGLGVGPGVDLGVGRGVGTFGGFGEGRGAGPGSGCGVGPLAGVLGVGLCVGSGVGPRGAGPVDVGTVVGFRRCIGP